MNTLLGNHKFFSTCLNLPTVHFILQKYPKMQVTSLSHVTNDKMSKPRGGASMFLIGLIPTLVQSAYCRRFIMRI